ncbi:hypothetical protein CPC08DRAFT_27732 [Agrocybe pediades]|nr:hypothetical protein CPC08DRAFT_27732 [Agrocybe pediades]
MHIICLSYPMRGCCGGETTTSRLINKWKRFGFRNSDLYPCSGRLISILVLCRSVGQQESSGTTLAISKGCHSRGWHHPFFPSIIAAQELLVHRTAFVPDTRPCLLGLFPVSTNFPRKLEALEVFLRKESYHILGTRHDRAKPADFESSGLHNQLQVLIGAVKTVYVRH